MRFGSLFAGIGGIDLGLERAGMNCKWQVEIDEFCQKVLNKHWPNVPKYGDIRDVGKENLETVDLIAGGFPCQPFSVAGKQRGTEDDRHLWPEMLRVISEIRPTWVIAENVTGIIPIFLFQAIFDLAREGFQTLPIILPACGFNAPHQRYRLFIIGYSEYNGLFASKKPKSTTQRSYNNKERESDASELKGSVEQYASLAYTNIQGLEGGERWAKQGLLSSNNFFTQCFWEALRKDELPEPTIRRGDDGFSSRVDELGTLGNAVVPQVAEHIGRMIMEVHIRNQGAS